MSNEVEELIGEGESQNTEFKDSLRLKKEIGETISAFSNTRGGIILIGISDLGEVIGVEVGKRTLEELANYLKLNTDPQMYPEINLCQVADRDIIAVKIKENDEKPVFFKTHAFKRVGRTNQRISTSEIRKLAREERKRLCFDERICEDASLDDIYESKVRKFLKRAKYERRLELNTDHIKFHAKIVGTERVEKWEYPIEAIREAITNAICHRDYETKSNVQVRIFDDRIEVGGCGLLPKPLTVDDLRKKHDSILRNPRIGKCFFLIKFIEQWGTGTNRIISECLKYGLPEPLFEEVAGNLVVTFRKTKFTEDYLKQLGLNERQIKAIDYLKENKQITRRKYSSLFNCSTRTAFNDLQAMIDKKILKRRGKGKYTYYEMV